VANGTDALVLALRALEVGWGDEVVVPSFTFYATAEAVASVGARPVFCDVDRATRNVSVETVKAAMGTSCKAIVAVDLFGSPAPIADLRSLGVPVVEDAAQAAGASLDGTHAGALGDIATLSFFPSKNLPGLGDGGAVLTGDEALAERVRALRFHGSRDKQTFELVGYNSRLNELQAAALRVLLPELDGWCEARRMVADRYEQAGLGRYVELPVVLKGGRPAWHLYVVCHPQADELIAQLAQRGVQARGYYRTPLHRQPAMASYLDAGLELPATDALAASNLALPMGPTLSGRQVDEVANAVASAATTL
jgi:dTDP-4-amino-4,6-dideoxygalactose transaminase